MNPPATPPLGPDEMYAQFEHHLAKNVHASAEAIARQMQLRHPSDERSHVAVARITAIRGRPQAAIAILEALEPAENRLPLAAAYLAELKLAAGATDQAALLAHVCLDEDDSIPVALKVAGIVAYQEGDLADAVQWLSRLVTLAPTDVAGWKALGKTYRALKRPRPACEAIENALAIDNKDVESWLELCRARLDGAEVEQARRDVSNALAIHPRNADLLTEANRIRQRGTTTTDPLRAELAATRALMDEGKLPEAALRLNSVFRVHRPTRAMKFARAELDAAQPGVDPLTMIPTVIALAKQYPEAWEPRALHAELLMRPGSMRNVREGLTHAEGAWTMSGGEPRVGLLLIRAYKDTGRTGLAEALGAQLKARAPHLSPRVDALLAR